MRSLDEQGRPRAEQVMGGIASSEHRGDAPSPCLPFGADMLALEAEAPRSVRGTKRKQEQDVLDFLNLATVMRSIGQVHALQRRAGLPGCQAGIACRAQARVEVELDDDTRVVGTLVEADARMNLRLAAAPHEPTHADDAPSAGEEAKRAQHVWKGRSPRGATPQFTASASLTELPTPGTAPAQRARDPSRHFPQLHT